MIIKETCQNYIIFI